MNMHFNGEMGPAETMIVAIENDFDFRSEEYASLFSVSEATGFQSPLWLDRFYKVLAPGVSALPLVLTVRSASRLLAVIPLVWKRTAGVAIVQSADLGVADYNRIACVPEFYAALSNDAELRAQLNKPVAFADIIFMRKVNRDSAIDSLFANSERSACENSAYIIDLAAKKFADWRQENLKKGFRKGIDRRRRKLEGEHHGVCWKHFVDENDINDAMNFIRVQRTKRFSDDILKNDAYFAFYRTCALGGAKTGETITSGIMVEGKLVSADFGVMGKGCLHSILCAADIDNFGPYAPGLQSLHDLIWERLNRGDTHFDAGLGNSRYKSDFSAREVPLDNLSVALSLKGKAIAAIYHRAKPVKNLLRNMVRSVH